MSKVTVRGSDILSAKLLKLSDLIEKAGRAAVKDETHEVAQQMRREAPVGETGKLREGIEEREVNGGLTGQAVSTVDYSTYVVHGTSSHQAQDYMTPAEEAARLRFKQRVIDEVNEALRKA